MHYKHVDAFMYTYVHVFMEARDDAGFLLYHVLLYLLVMLNLALTDQQNQQVTQHLRL